MTLTLTDSPRHFAVVSVSSGDGRPLAEATGLLVAAVDKAENPGMEWNADRTSGGASTSARGPVEIVPVSGEIAVTTTAAAAEVWALDAAGARRSAVPCRVEDGTLRFTLAAEHRTPWYEVVAQRPPATGGR